MFALFNASGAASNAADRTNLPFRVHGHRFVFLDALRGVAAIAVIFFHRKDMLPGNLFKHGYLAVDFFFMLSGFVIAYAYEDKLRSKMHLGDFVVKRLKRLMPLVVLGATLGLSIETLRAFWKSDPALLHDAIITFPFTAATLPSPRTQSFEAFGVNPVVWSLFFELIANFVYAAIVRKLSNTLLITIIAISGLAMVAIGFSFDSVEVGNKYSSLQFGLARVTFPFFFGVLLFRLRNVDMRALGGVSATLIAVSLAGILLAPVATPGLNFMYDMASVALVFPCLIYLGAQVQPFSGGASHVMEMAGNLSYAVYILHFPLLGALHFPLTAISATTPVKFFVYLMVILPFSYVATVFFDRPVQKLLNRPKALAS